MARPRQFEPDEALAAIKNAFWRHGYDATSMQDIEAATGLKKQSLYRLYGDKRGMYLKALDHYAENEAGKTLELLEEAGSVHSRFQRLFTHLVDIAAAGDRRGCFYCNASIDQAPADDKTRASIAEKLETVRKAFGEALADTPAYKTQHAVREKKAAALFAAYLGLRVMVRAGVSEDILRQAVNDAIAGIE